MNGRMGGVFLLENSAFKVAGYAVCSNHSAFVVCHVSFWILLNILAVRGRVSSVAIDS